MRLALAITLICWFASLAITTQWHRVPASDALTKENADLRAQVREGDAKWAAVQAELVGATQRNVMVRCERDEARRERDAARAATQRN